MVQRRAASAPSMLDFIHETFGKGIIMNSFEFQCGTRIIFGAGKEACIADQVRAYGGTNVLLVFGGGSVKRSGLLPRVEGYLDEAGIAWTELGGVKPNPELGLVHEGVALCREKKIDFVLAVGGGSAIDTAKAIALGVPYDGDVWDFFDNLVQPTTILPLATILTLPATGSEMSRATVITKEDGGIKKGLNRPMLRPLFSILNPELTYTLPPYQTASGAVDILMHTMERFFSKSNNNELTDLIAESIMRVVIRNTPLVLANPTDYEPRSEIMWAGSISHCELTGLGLPGDWASHQIEHELSTAYDVAHGAGLAAVWGSWARYTIDQGLERFAKYAKDIWGIDTGDAKVDGLAAIEKTEDFFRSIGMPTCLSELIGRTISEDEIKALAHKCTFFGTRTIGNLIVMKEPEIEDVYRLANH